MMTFGRLHLPRPNRHWLLNTQELDKNEGNNDGAECDRKGWHRVCLFACQAANNRSHSTIWAAHCQRLTAQDAIRFCDCYPLPVCPRPAILL
jgi:hypothetical protein